MINKNISFSLYYKFDAKIIAVPQSNDRIGVDIYPRYHIQPTELLEVMNFSKDPASMDLGYQKDKESQLYLKNLTNFDVDEIEAQYDFFRMLPPYWFSTDDEYANWVKITMDPVYSNSLKARYNGALATQNPVEVPELTDENIGLKHFYVKSTFYTTKNWKKTIAKKWPLETDTFIQKVDNV